MQKPNKEDECCEILSSGHGRSTYEPTGALFLAQDQACQNSIMNGPLRPYL